MHNKRAEFMAYLEEVKGLSYDSLSNGMLKEEFRGFMEDYNTATMPHVKFYSMERFEVSEAQRKKKDMKKLLHKQMKEAAREGNTRFDESLLSDKRKQQYEQERLQGERAELGEMAYVCAPCLPRRISRSQEPSLDCWLQASGSGAGSSVHGADLRLGE